MVGLRHRFASRAGEVTVLDGVDLHLASGEHAALVGASGVGKTTLLSVLGWLVLRHRGDATSRSDEVKAPGLHNV